MELTLGEAAKVAGVSKPTLSKALKAGRLSGVKREDGSYAINPAELDRWKQAYTHRHPKSSIFEETVTAATPEGATVEMRVANARMDAELTGLRALLAAETARAETAERDRDAWRDEAKAQTLLLTHQAQTPPQTPPQEAREGRGGLFGWLSGRKAANG